MKTAWVLVFCIVCSLSLGSFPKADRDVRLSGCAGVVVSPDLVFATTRNEMGDIGPRKYQHYLEAMQRIKREHLHTTIEAIGTTTGVLTRNTDYMFYYEVEETPPSIIYAMDAMPEQEKLGQLILLGGAHAREHAGPEAAIQTFERILNSETPLAKLLKRHYQITVVPVVDIDHFDAGEDRQHYSLLTNNMYNDLESPLTWEPFRKMKRPHGPGGEAQSIARLTKERFGNARFKLALDFHEAGFNPTSDLKGYFFVYPGDESYEPFVDGMVSRFQSREIPLDASYIKREWVRDGTFAYLVHSLGGLGFTLESPMRILGVAAPAADRVHMHLNAADQIVGQFLKKSHSLP